MVDSYKLSRPAKHSLQAEAITCAHHIVAKFAPATLPRPLNVTQASHQLNLPINAIRVLCKRGFFTCFGGTPTTGQSWWIDANSLELPGALFKRQRSPACTISLRNLLRHPFMTAEGIISFFRAVQEGALSVSIDSKSDTRRIGDWRLRKDESDRWLIAHMEQVARSQPLSIRQAAKYANVTCDVVYDLTRHGLLNSTVELRNGIASQTIDLSSIEQFKSSYILGKELTQILHLTSKQTAVRIINRGTTPVAGLPPAPLRCRQYVWPRRVCFEKMRESLNDLSRLFCSTGGAELKAICNVAISAK